ncbi:MAG: AbrB/MazE/SpoVT family DNA-binding domain-containing protein [Sinimarinibacterium flocculans]|uniref:AbrB/MazE/SpoVT family DNA-binding domain-containing protein n=1 Tax=Sinimarinibacterium flocculans TaxID=985250 RepID=UPI003C631D77
MDAVTVSPKFQVVIPQAVRESLGLEPGVRMQVLQYENRIEFIPQRPARALRGSLRGIDTAVVRDDDRT